MNDREIYRPPALSPEYGDDGPRTLPRFAIWLTAAMCLFAILFVYTGRLIGPNDLFRKDQSKTMAYTVDIIENGRFSLPRDSIFQPATKPPLYNWLAVLFVGPTGIYDEWAQKMPSLIGALVVAGMLFAWCRRNFADAVGKEHALILAMLAGTVWIASKSTILLMYIARPDMVQAACLVAAWFAGNAALKFDSKREARRYAILFWIATTAAALAKGPAAVYPMAYVLLAAPLIHGNWRRLKNLHWVTGLLFLFGSVGIWLGCAAAQDWPHVRDVLLGSEVAKRIVESRIEGGTKPAHYALMWFIQQNTVWSYLMLGSMVISLLGSLRRYLCDESNTMPLPGSGQHQLSTLFDFIGIRKTEGFFTGAAGMANLWAIVVVGCLSIPKDKRMDFLLPAHPAAAILAAHFIIFLVSRFTWARFALPMLGALLLLDEKRTVSTWMELSAGLIFAGFVVGTIIATKRRASLVPIACLVAAIGYVAFQFFTNTRWGVIKIPSPGVNYAAFIGGAAIVASLFVAATSRFRFELPMIVCGVLVWSYALLQNNYKDTGLPATAGTTGLHKFVASIYNRDPTSSGTNPSVYAATFAKKAKAIVGDDKVVMIIRSKSPIMTLMGRHQGSYLTRKDFEEAKWVIAERTKFLPLSGTAQEALFSGRLDIDFGHIVENPDIYKDRVSLFRIENGVPSVDEMISIHRWVTDWTKFDANPYRSDNTGWIEHENDPPKWTPQPGDPWEAIMKKRTKQ